MSCLLESLPSWSPEWCLSLMFLAPERQVQCDLFVGVVAELVAGVVPPVDVLGSGETGSM